MATGDVHKKFTEDRVERFQRYARGQTNTQTDICMINRAIKIFNCDYS